MSVSSPIVPPSAPSNTHEKGEKGDKKRAAHAASAAGPNSPAPGPAVPRVVKIQCERVRDGILPVVISVTPTADLDVRQGVFIDVRLEPPADLPTAAAHPASGAATPETAGPTSITSPMLEVTVPAAAGNGAAKKGVMKSHRVAPARQLKGGREETFNTEIAIPAPDPSGRSWLVRGRFGSGDGNDLRSAWTRVR